MEVKKEDKKRCRLVFGKTDEGDTEISLGYALAKHNRMGTESVIRSEADGRGQRQTDTQSLSKSGPSVVSQMDVDPPRVLHGGKKLWERQQPGDKTLTWGCCRVIPPLIRRGPGTQLSPDLHNLS